jgi:signal transduction histidine kinase
MQQTEIISFILFGNIILLIFIAGTVLFIIQYRKRKKEHIKEKIMISEKYTKELLSTQLEIQQQTMQHIGREIHDNVGQKLTLASLYTQQLSYENKAPQITDKIETISNIINESLSELRSLSKSLTDNTIADKNIEELIAQECKNVNQLQKCRVDFSFSGRMMKLDYQAKNILLRIVQEFLQNSMKHSGCTTVCIKLEQAEQHFFLLLEDDGKGFDPDIVKYKGIGLTNMKKRTESIGGTLKLTAQPEKGTQINITIPIST